jgi:hypothetical protein
VSCPSAESAQFRFEAYTLKVIEAILPGFKTHELLEYICKIMRINGKHGKRFANGKLYDHLSQEYLVNLIYDLICEADSVEVFLVQSGPMRRALKWLGM